MLWYSFLDLSKYSESSLNVGVRFLDLQRHQLYHRLIDLKIVKCLWHFIVLTNDVGGDVFIRGPALWGRLGSEPPAPVALIYALMAWASLNVPTFLLGVDEMPFSNWPPPPYFFCSLERKVDIFQVFKSFCLGVQMEAFRYLNVTPLWTLRVPQCGATLHSVLRYPSGYRNFHIST